MYGNNSFKGNLGISLCIILRLKLFANIALVGLPNAGKSTILFNITNAKPIIANYFFSTLQPYLGVVFFSGGPLMWQFLFIVLVFFSIQYYFIIQLEEKKLLELYICTIF